MYCYAFKIAWSEQNVSFLDLAFIAISNIQSDNTQS